MIRFLVMCAMVTVIFGQETLTKVKIDRQTQAKLAALFEELPQSMEVYITADSNYVIEAMYADQKTVKELTMEEYQALMLAGPAKRVILENARLQYLIGQTLHGLSLYSWSLPITLGLEDRSAMTVGLITPLVYTSGIFLMTAGMRVSNGAECGAFLGGIEGAVHGGLAFLSERAIFPGSITENFIDFALGQTMGFTQGMFQRKFNHCIYGYYHYFAGKTLAVGWENDDIWESGEDIAQIGTAISLLEGYSSLYHSRHDEHVTYGDAIFELRCATLGAELIPLVMATYDLHRGERSDERIYAATSLAGYGCGYLLGRKLSRDYDLSETAGAFTWLIPYLAHSATGGIVFLMDNESLEHSYPVIFLALDLPLTYLCYKTFAKRPVKYGGVKVNNLKLAINPAFFLMKGNVHEDIPLVTVSYSF